MDKIGLVDGDKLVQYLGDYRTQGEVSKSLTA